MKIFKKLINFKKKIRKRKVLSVFTSSNLKEHSLMELIQRNYSIEVKINKIRHSRNHWKTEGIFFAIFPGYRGFSENLYLEQNPDVRSAVQIGKFKDGYDHFVKHGFAEAILGDRVLPFDFSERLFTQDKIKDFFDGFLYINALQECGLDSNITGSELNHFSSVGLTKISEGELAYKYSIRYENKLYAEVAKDVNMLILLGDFCSYFEHFLLFGHKELKERTREYKRSLSLYEYQRPVKTEEIAYEIENFRYKPTISIVMPVFNVDPKWLKLAIKSINDQWYKNWELCICDDHSSNQLTLDYLKELESINNIHVIYSSHNQNISLCSNKALENVTGDFVALMDNDDELSVDALYEVVKVLQNRNITFVYSDEDKLEINGKHVEPHFKPDFSPEMFHSHNYVSHLGVICKKLVDEVGGWKTGFEGAQDYDLYLRLSECKNFTPYHISKVLYHWRKIPGSTAATFGEKSYANFAGKKSLEAMLKRNNILAKVDYGKSLGTYKINYDIVGNPLVTIVIPFKDKPSLLKTCLESIINLTDYKNYEIIAVDNQSTAPEIKKLTAYYSEIHKNIKFIKFDDKFNYSAINNYAVNNFSSGEHIVFLNNDIEIINGDWLHQLLSYSQRSDIGAVGAKLLYPDGKIQHAGIVITPYTPHSVMTAFQAECSTSSGYFSRLNSVANYSAVTAALLMVKKDLFEIVHGFDEKLAVAYNDVDLCLKIQNEGYRNVLNPYVEAIHHESVSRGYEDNIDKLKRLASEKHTLISKNIKLFESYDPYFNINLDYYSPIFNVDKYNSVNGFSYLPQPYKEEIIYEIGNTDGVKNKVCIFAHFDKQDIIDEYVIDYLSELSKRYSIIFVTTSSAISTDELTKIMTYCALIVVKKNLGYDFGSWKTGIDKLGERLETLEELLLCNDSVYGPISSLDKVFNSKKFNSCDLFSISDNFEISYHLQSFFIVYKSKILKSHIFQKFWSDLKIFKDKNDLVLFNEIMYIRRYLNSNYKCVSYVDSTKLSYLNNLHYFWKDLLIEHDFPFLKVELVRANPLKVDITEFKQVVDTLRPGYSSIITNHLSRLNTVNNAKCS